MVGSGLAGVAAAEAAEDFAVGGHEEGEPGQVMVECERAKIEAARVGQPKPNKACRRVADQRMETNHLVVEAFFVGSVPADKDSEDRAVPGAGQALGGVQVEQPASCFLFRERRRKRGREADPQGRSEQSAGGRVLHEGCSEG